MHSALFLACLGICSVFAGGFDVEADLDVCPAATIEGLAALAERSLLVVDERGGPAEPRYRMLKTVRGFAGERLAEAGEVDLIRGGHSEVYLLLFTIRIGGINPSGRSWSPIE